MAVPHIEYKDKTLFQVSVHSLDLRLLPEPPVGDLAATLKLQMLSAFAMGFGATIDTENTNYDYLIIIEDEQVPSFLDRLSQRGKSVKGWEFFTPLDFGPVSTDAVKSYNELSDFGFIHISHLDGNRWYR